MLELVDDPTIAGSSNPNWKGESIGLVPIKSVS